MLVSPFRNSLLAFSLPLFDDDQDKGGAKDDEKPDGKQGAAKEEKNGKGYTPPATQEDLDAIVANRLARARRTMSSELRAEVEEEVRAELAAEVAKENEDYKSLYEAEVKKTQKYEAEKKAAEHEALREKVAKDAGLPASSMKFLVGETEAELKASAKELGELVKPKKAEDTDAGNTLNGDQSRRKEAKEDYEDPSFWNLDILPAKQ